MAAQPLLVAAAALALAACGAAIGDGVEADPDAGAGVQDDDDDDGAAEPDAAPDTVVESDCTEGDARVEHDGHCYALIVSNKITWTEAESACVALGGHLASITSATELAALAPLATTVSDENVWIGINDRSSGGDFVWTTGEPVSFTDWGSGEPSDSDDDDDCGNFVGAGVDWNDDDCRHDHAYLCERVSNGA
jgi:C-type mannose receptor